jgi:hypothetical protein
VLLLASKRALGVRLEKPSPKGWPAAYWAVVANSPRAVVTHGTASPPRSYDEAIALRHLHEAIVAAVRENVVGQTFVWGIEANARMNNSMRPRFRAEGVVCAAAASAGSSVKLVAWSEIESRSGADLPKAEYETASHACGLAVGDADGYALLAAIAALGG